MLQVPARLSASAVISAAQHFDVSLPSLGFHVIGVVCQLYLFSKRHVFLFTGSHVACVCVITTSYVLHK